MDTSFATPGEIGAILRRRRRQQKLTQAETARRAGVRQGTVSDLENGRSVHLETLLRIGAVLQIRFSAVERDGTPSPTDADWLETL